MVRVFQGELFYDPFIAFFKTDYHINTLPDYNLTKLICYLILRYAINSIISLGIIYALFQNMQFIRLASILYLGAFLILIVLFLILLLNLDSNWYYLFFNVRRFLIHPVLLILFTAAFFSHDKS
jgi:exosortase F-associated protein